MSPWLNGVYEPPSIGKEKPYVRIFFFLEMRNLEVWTDFCECAYNLCAMLGLEA